jgi:hypothetical protein
MRPADNIEESIRKLRYKTDAKTHKRVLGNVLQTLDKNEKQKSGVIKPDIWRTIMKTQITKVATAMLIIIAVVVSVTFLGKSTTATYAIEQTIEANRIMRYLHLKYFDSLHDDVARECWFELDESGQLKNVRINWSEWMAGGEKVVWNQEKTEIWNKKQGLLLIFDDKIYTERILTLTSKNNPRLSVERYYELKTKGEARIEIQEPADKSEPVIVTVTGLLKNINRYILFVDQATKLVTGIEWYRLKDGEYEYQGLMEYSDYNVPIDTKMFSLDDEISPDAICIDTRTQDVGLIQESLTDKEIAAKVATQFFEALINRDYTKVSQICGGLPPNEIQQGSGKFWIKFLGKINVMRIISIGEPYYYESPHRDVYLYLSVPCIVEVEIQGKTFTQQMSPLVRQVLGRRERWMVHGLAPTPVKPKTEKAQK